MTRLLFLFVSLITAVFSLAQPSTVFYDSVFIQKHRIKSVTKYTSEYDDQIERGITKPDLSKHFQKTWRAEFSRQGKLLKEIDYPEVELFPDRWNSRDSITYIKDAEGQIIEKRYYKFDSLQSSEIYELNEKGLVVATRTYTPGYGICLKDSSVYDERGNHLLMVYGNCFDKSERRRFVKRYNSNNRVIYVSETDIEGNPLHVDSTIYDAEDNYLENYWFDNIEGKMLVTDKYLATYDNRRNKTSEKRYQGREQELTSHIDYNYNENNLLVEQIMYGEYYKTKYRFSYNEKGILSSMKVRSNNPKYTEYSQQEFAVIKVDRWVCEYY